MQSNCELTRSQDSLTFESPANKKIKLSTSTLQLSSLNPTMEDNQEETNDDPYAVYENDSISSADEHELSAKIEKIDVVDEESNDNGTSASNPVEQQQQAQKPLSPPKRSQEIDKNVELTPNDKIKALLKLSRQAKQIKKESFLQSSSPQNTQNK
jgi:hypothetical protein